MDNDSTRLFIGNLNYKVDKHELEELFAQHGEVLQLNLLADRGIAFVDMGSLEQGMQAILHLHEYEHMGRKIRVEMARPKEQAY